MKKLFKTTRKLCLGIATFMAVQVHGQQLVVSTLAGGAQAGEEAEGNGESAVMYYPYGLDVYHREM